MPDRQIQSPILIGFTAIFLGYLMVWLPGPSAGLQFLGLEMGEWSKFLGVGLKRNWFYLPPITLALMMLFFTAGWENRRVRTWLFRGVAFGVSLLAFPALEDIIGPSHSDYLSRIAGVFLVAAVALVLPLLKAKGWGWLASLANVSILLAGLSGALWPTLIFLEVRPFASHIIGTEMGFGPGFWLNLLGHGLVLVFAGRGLVAGRITNSTPTR